MGARTVMVVYLRVLPDGSRVTAVAILEAPPQKQRELPLLPKVAA